MENQKNKKNMWNQNAILIRNAAMKKQKCAIAIAMGGKVGQRYK